MIINLDKCPICNTTLNVTEQSVRCAKSPFTIDGPENETRHRFSITSNKVMMDFGNTPADFHCTDYYPQDKILHISARDIILTLNNFEIDFTNFNQNEFLERVEQAIELHEFYS